MDLPPSPMADRVEVRADDVARLRRRVRAVAWAFVLDTGLALALLGSSLLGGVACGPTGCHMMIGPWVLPDALETMIYVTMPLLLLASPILLALWIVRRRQLRACLASLA